MVLLFSLIAGISGLVFAVGLRSWNSALNRAKVRQDCALAMERMVRELAQTDSVARARVGDVTVDVDLDNNGANESLEFDVDNANNLTRDVDGVTTILASGVGTFTLSYLDADNNTLSAPVNPQATRDTIRVISILMTASQGDESFTLSSSAYCRNQ